MFAIPAIVILLDADGRSVAMVTLSCLLLFICGLYLLDYLDNYEYTPEPEKIYQIASIENKKNKRYTYYDITYKDESGTFYTQEISKTKALIHEIQDKDKNQYPYGYITIQTKYGKMTFTKKTQYDIYLYEQDINKLLNNETT